jgi:CHAD domain-containing protein
MAVATANGTYREIEIKLDADADFTLPELTGLPGVERVEDAEVQDLDAVYLDSADLRLIRHGTTFRRRTGGEDAGWHLKLADAKHSARTEIRRAPGRSVDAVPPKLLELLRAQLRGEQVAPVARISTRRTVRRLVGADDVVLAEVADDQVTAEAMGEELTTSVWRELEVELVDGEPGLLDAAADLLTGAGARPSDTSSKVRRALSHRLDRADLPEFGPGAGAEQLDSSSPAPKAKRKAKSKAKAESKAKSKGKAESKSKAKSRTNEPESPTSGDVVLAYLREQLAALITQDPQVRLDTEEGVHQMRVATRRLRTVLAAFRPFFTERAAEPLRAELKWLGGELGKARDAQVMRGLLHEQIAQQPVELVMGPVLRRVDLELKAAYRDARADVVAALDSDRYLALLAALEAFLADPPFSERARTPGTAELRRAVRKSVRRVVGAHSELASGTPGYDHQLHRVRIAAKRARYAAEAVKPAVGMKAKRVAAAMSDIQETLGEHQDAVVERGWLRDLAVRSFLAGENSFTLGRLHGLTEARTGPDERAFAQVWRDTRKAVSAWPGK